MFKSLLAVLVLALGTLSIVVTGQEKAIPKDLIQYIRDARKAGLSDEQIQAKAVQAGWPALTVTEAFGKQNSGGSSVPKAEPSAPTTEPTAKANPDAARPAGWEAGIAPTMPAVMAQPGPNGSVAPPAAAAVGTLSTEEASIKTGSSRGVSDDYRIGEGDVLQVSVWGERDASVPAVVVRHDGRISMPLIKEVTVAGLTPPEAEKLITEQLSKMLKAPDVTIIVAQINSKKIFMTGAVKKEGPMPFSYRMRVLQAISEAGGLTDYAKPTKIYVLRTQDGRDFKFPFNYKAVLRGEHMEQNIFLQPGDTVVVPH